LWPSGHAGYKDFCKRRLGRRARQAVRAFPYMASIVEADDFEEAVEEQQEEEEREDEEKFEEAQEEAPNDEQLAAEAAAAAEAAKAAIEAANREADEKLQAEDDAVMKELDKLTEEAAAAAKSDKEVEAKPPDPALQPPAPMRTDWEGHIGTLGSLVKDETAEAEKVRVLHAALVQRIEDTKNLDEHKATALRRLEDATKERDRCKQETQRAIQAQHKLEGSCRELQQQKTTIAKENRRIAEEEGTRHTELKVKFEQAIKDVQEKMDAELEVRTHFLKENEELRGKLQKFTETYEAQEKQLAEQRQSREAEMEVAQKRLEEHETMCQESKIKSASLEKHNEVLRKSQTVLREELQTILAKFDEFHEAVTGSNTKHSECKKEIDDLQTKLQEFEKDNVDLKAATDVKTATEEHKVAEKQRDALERLCDNLSKENQKLQEQLKGLRRAK